MQSLFLVAAIIGFVELVKRIFARDWQAVSIIAGAAAIGAVAGYFGVDGLTIPLGIQLGLSAAGIYRVGETVSGK
jgi:hypothetical protein